nr:isoform 2 of probable cyclic nucleotide-gated ion channel 5 [Quercus suber]
MREGSDGLRTIGRSLRSGVTRAVFPEDLKVSEKKIFDPQDKSLLLWNRLFVISCILAVSIDPLFFYLPVFIHASNCLVPHSVYGTIFSGFWTSTLGQGLETSTYPGEVLFSILIAISGLLLFALLIGNMQTYFQSLTVRVEEMRIKRRDSEQWMHHLLLPQDLRERVRRYDQYKWLEARGVDEESLVQSLPKDLRRDIKRHLCLNLVRRVPLFANMDERLLDAICERLKPSLYTERTYIVRKGDPVDEMLFIIRGRLESVTTEGGRSGFFNRGLLKEGDFCGEELLTWALDPKAGSNLPSSTRTVKALTEVEAFALEAEELKFVAFIAVSLGAFIAGRALVSRSDSTSRLDATILASRFAANALRGHRLRNPSARGLVKLQKPPEPDFTNYDSEN